MRQDDIRQEFNQWLEDNDYPTIKRVCMKLGINSNYMTHWRMGRRNFGEENLNKVIKHIRK
ncbi:hypothetical protein JTF04_11550 [Mammaliicoccus vitulinus]|uniref:hypothetical protein n=1 Tax=Mammaliicoccus vitulinus TaxID=71237 RepID=UPI0019506B58|nr:hypothetical protein [Mammaliicoccus vitulinus]MBM6630321.1 hypothetical protein [Mammaliicoccus vitulinus]